MEETGKYGGMIWVIYGLALAADAMWCGFRRVCGRGGYMTAFVFIFRSHVSYLGSVIDKNVINYQ
jgi:hypothetical protein